MRVPYTYSDISWKETDEFSPPPTAELLEEVCFLSSSTSSFRRLWMMNWCCFHSQVLCPFIRTIQVWVVCCWWVSRIPSRIPQWAQGCSQGRAYIMFVFLDSVAFDFVHNNLKGLEEGWIGKVWYSCTVEKDTRWESIRVVEWPFQWMMLSMNLVWVFLWNMSRMYADSCCCLWIGCLYQWGNKDSGYAGSSHSTNSSVS